jgi:chromate transporter
MATSDHPPPDAMAQSAEAEVASSSPGRPDSSSIGPTELFLAFSGLALSGFGGVLPFAYRALVEKRKWLDAREFASLLAIAQVMPGPTICNLSVMIGQRYAGFAGSCAALAGMVLGPACIVVLLGIAWQHYGGLSAVKHALSGMSAVAIGLFLATAVKMGMNLFKPDSRAQLKMTPAKAPSVEASSSPAPSYWSGKRVIQVVLCALAFAGVGLLHWPLVLVVAGLAPFAIGLSWFTDARPGRA